MSLLAFKTPNPFFTNYIFFFSLSSHPFLWYFYNHTLKNESQRQHLLWEFDSFVHERRMVLSIYRYIGIQLLHWSYFNARALLYQPCDCITVSDNFQFYFLFYHFFISKLFKQENSVHSGCKKSPEWMVVPCKFTAFFHHWTKRNHFNLPFQHILGYRWDELTKRARFYSAVLHWSLC